MRLLLLIVLTLLLMGAFPNFGYHSYGHAPSGLFGVVALALLVIFLTADYQRFLNWSRPEDAIVSMTASE